MKHRFLRCLCLLLCLLLLVPAAMAKEIILDIEYIPITQSGFAADSLYGVPALYNRWDPIMCVELVERYYAELYGLELYIPPGEPKVAGTDDFWFEETTAPKTGDVAFAPGWKRGTWYNHYAICKYVDQEEDYILLIEQNWSWNGEAGIERRIPYKDSCYTFFTLRGKDGDPQPQIPAVHQPSDWALPYLEKAAKYHTADTVVDGYRLPVTRKVLAGMLYRTALALGKEAPEGQRPMEAVQTWGLMDAGADGELRASDTLSREQAAVILIRFLRFVGRVPELEDELAVFAEDASHTETLQALLTLQATGLDRLNQESFCPDKAVTTEQMLAQIVRIAENPNPVNLLKASQQTGQLPQARSAGSLIAEDTPLFSFIARSKAS